MIFSVAYMLARRLLGCLMVLARREVSKDAELLVLRNENRARPRRATEAAELARVVDAFLAASLPGHRRPQRAASCRYEACSRAGAARKCGAARR